MKTYETTFITREKLADKLVKKVLSELAGKILNLSESHEKQFSYKIGKEAKGVYTTILFEIEPEKVAEFNKKLSQEDEVIRFLTISVKPVKIEKKKEKVTEKLPKIKEEPITEEKLEKSIQKEALDLKEKIEIPKSKKISRKTKVEASKSKDETSGIEATQKERLEALDKKLDELLKE